MKPTVEEVRARLGLGGPPDPAQAADPRPERGTVRRIPTARLPWLRAIFAGRLYATVTVWGARHTTRSLERLGALEVEPLPGGYERIRLAESVRWEVDE